MSADLQAQPGLDDIEKLISYMSQALPLIPDDHPGKIQFLADLGSTYDDRFDILGELDDLQKAIEYMSAALGIIPDDHCDLPLLLTNLAAVHSKRFGLLGERRDNEREVEYASRALSLTSDGDPDLPSILSNLGISHRNRFARLGELGDLEDAIEYESRALKLMPDDHPNLPILLNSLMLGHSNRFERLGQMEDLEKAIEYGSRAVVLTPNEHPMLASILGNLGMSHSIRFERLGEQDDIKKAVEYESRVVTLTHNDHPRLSTSLANLGTSHSSRFEQLGELDDLNQAIEYGSRAVALTPKDHPNLSGRLSDLGLSHRYRFERLGELDDVEKAIEYESRAITVVPDDHPELPSMLGNLGASHIVRLQHLGELEDLGKAIEYQSRAVSLTPDDHPHLSSHLSNIAASYSIRFNLLGDLDDLNKAIEYDSCAVALIPDDHPDFADRLANLGVSYSHRFDCLGELEDVENAIEYESGSVALTPESHPHLPRRLANLGAFHSDRFERFGTLDDLEKAIQFGSSALALTPAGHPDLLFQHFNFAKSCLLQYHSTEDASCLQRSLDSFRMATQPLTGAPRDRFAYAFRWAKLAAKYGSLNCLEAYQTAIDLLPQFIWLGATTGQRYHDLLQAQNLAVEATSVAIHSSNYELALEWIEHARCVVWNQILMLRSPVDRLRSSHPELATRLQVIANQLRTAGSGSREAQALSSGGTLAAEQVAQGHRRLAKEYNDLLSRARTLPGFEDLLLPIKASKLVGAAQNGPVVVINCHEDRCDALVILPGEDNVTHIPLPNFTGENARYTRSKMEKSLRSRGRTEFNVERRPVFVVGEDTDFESMLEVLWYDVVKPILDSLGYITDFSTGRIPHITWCPTGTLSFLPLHAAGDYKQTRSRVFDYVISSYTPTLTGILTANPGSFSRKLRILAVGQEATPGHSQLPGTTKELAFIQAHTQSLAEYTQIVNDQATTAVVLDAMEQHDWVHLACHAHQNVADPTSSGFFLHDGVLNLAAVNRRSFNNKGLAFLSACQTATGDKALPDEAIHLASGMLMAGYPSVIATMWSVVDDDAPFVADKVYGELMKVGKIENGAAGKALHNAVSGLRERVGEKEFERWVPYIHVGS
ncbi:unnamed protein product [Rhizoctonia solani]|uniref:CHAT domain-containing protein n=1 Tax=Rhizoctonia solani TaxID=456999 RepID=A0A8H3BA89_9AGAM|nr:unnamed protein product [Rhizoctonia solani]